MAGYSGTPLPTKLGIKADHRLLFVGAPEGFEETLGALPPGATASATRAPLDVIVLFVKSTKDLHERLAELAPRLEPAGGLWIAWPKKSSGVPTDVTEQAVRGAGLDLGLVDNKVCAVDDTWSGLRFVYRVAERPAANKKKKK